MEERRKHQGAALRGTCHAPRRRLGLRAPGSPIGDHHARRFRGRRGRQPAAAARHPVLSCRLLRRGAGSAAATRGAENTHREAIGPVTDGVSGQLELDAPGSGRETARTDSAEKRCGAARLARRYHALNRDVEARRALLLARVYAHLAPKASDFSKAIEELAKTLGDEQLPWKRLNARLLEELGIQELKLGVTMTDEDLELDEPACFFVTDPDGTLRLTFLKVSWEAAADGSTSERLVLVQAYGSSTLRSAGGMANSARLEGGRVQFQATPNGTGRFRLVTTITPSPAAAQPAPPKAPDQFRNEASLVAASAPLPGVRSWTLETCPHRDRVEVAQVSPDGRWLATAERTGIIRIFDTSDGRLQQVIASHRAQRRVTEGTTSAAGTALKQGKLWCSPPLAFARCAGRPPASCWPR